MFTVLLKHFVLQSMYFFYKYETYSARDTEKFLGFTFLKVFVTITALLFYNTFLLINK